MPFKFLHYNWAGHAGQAWGQALCCTWLPLCSAAGSKPPLSLPELYFQLWGSGSPKGAWLELSSWVAPATAETDFALKGFSI